MPRRRAHSLTGMRYRTRIFNAGAGGGVSPQDLIVPRLRVPRPNGLGPLSYHFCSFAKSGTFGANGPVERHSLPLAGIQDQEEGRREAARINHLVTRGITMDQEVEYVARALYEAEDDALIWETEPEILKEEFRRYARAAIAMLPRQKRDAPEAQKNQFPYAA